MTSVSRLPLVLRTSATPLSVRASLREVWGCRELVWALAQRDFLVRFKQTYVGLLWVLLKPLMWLLTLTFVFGHVVGGNGNTSGVPYALVVLAGLVPWQFFAGGVAEVTNSLANNRHILTKVYFPRLALPIAALMPPVADFIAAFVVLLATFLWYQYCPTWRIVFLPCFIGLLMLMVGSLGIWLSALSVRMRDIQMLLPFGLQLGMYLSPVGYQTGRVPEGWSWLYNLNPLVGILEGFRWCLLDLPGGLHWKALAVSLVASVVLAVSGLAYFNKVERKVADVL